MSEATPRRRRWLWVVGGVVLAGLCVPPACYYLIRVASEGKLAAARAELDAEDPNWRLPDLIAARNARLKALPVNSADTAAEVVKLLPAGWDRTDEGVKQPWPDGDHPNRLPAEAEAARLKAVREQIAPAVAVAWKLRDQPDGGTVIDIGDPKQYMLNINLTAVQDRRQVAHALSTDSGLAAVAGDPAAAVRSAHALLHVSRSIGDDPFLISQLVRCACAAIAAKAAERVVGLGQPDAGLDELRAALLREAGEPMMAHGLRSELASVDQMMDNLRAGTVAGGGAGLPPASALNPYWAHDHAFALRFLRRAIVDQRQPAHLRDFKAIEAELKAEPRLKIPLSRLLLPAVDKCTAAGIRTEAMLRAAAVGLACERHRRTTGNWPASLAELVLPPAAWTDPYDGQPLRYKRTPDGAVVYSVGENRKDDGGQDQVGTTRLADLVFRLFDLDKRRLPALPPPADDAP